MGSEGRGLSERGPLYIFSVHSRMDFVINNLFLIDDSCIRKNGVI